MLWVERNDPRTDVEKFGIQPAPELFEVAGEQCIARPASVGGQLAHRYRQFLIPGVKARAQVGVHDV